MTRTSLRIALFATLVAVLALVPSALAGKGRPGPADSGGLSLVVMDGAAQATHRGRITFNVSTTATDRPFVGVRCWQGSNWMYDAYVGYFPDAMFDQWFVLDSAYWAAGVATSCTARLFYYDRRGNQKVLSSMTFSVAS